MVPLELLRNMIWDGGNGVNCFGTLLQFFPKIVGDEVRRCKRIRDWMAVEMIVEWLSQKG